MGSYLQKICVQLYKSFRLLQRSTRVCDREVLHIYLQITRRHIPKISALIFTCVRKSFPTMHVLKHHLFEYTFVEVMSLSKLPTHTRVGTLIVATIYLQLIQNTHRYMFRSFTVLQCSHQHCVQPVASDVEVVGYL